MYFFLWWLCFFLGLIIVSGLLLKVPGFSAKLSNRLDKIK
jgi:hypothetical protein